MKKQKIDQFQLFSALQSIHSRKIRTQNNVKDLLPPEDVDFAPYFNTIVPDDLVKPEDTRRNDMENHYKNLRYGARGKPEAVALQMLLISYLRRDTAYNDRAWSLFDRLWREHVTDLLELLPPRDIVSAFRTFADHEDDLSRRLLAKLCFTYTHMIKLYESERLYSGQSLKSIDFDIPAPCPVIGVQHLWGVRFGGDNSFEILHLELMEEVLTDEVLGPMLLHIMWCVQQGDTIFSRFDKARVEADYNIHHDGEWSFGFNPYAPLDEDESEA